MQDTIREAVPDIMNCDIIDVSTSTILTKDLICYAKTCSFQGTGSYLAELLSDSAFEDYERVYAAIRGQKIIGFAAILKESCVENDDCSPWLDFLFVEEKYRNQRIGLALIREICGYARNIGFDFLYLCTLSHIEYYKKAGFEVLYKTDCYNGARYEESISIMRKQLFLSEFPCAPQAAEM